MINHSSFIVIINGNVSKYNYSFDIAAFRQSMMSAFMILIPVYLFGIFSNITLMITIIKNKKFHTPSYYLSVNMAFSDIILQFYAAAFLILNLILTTMASSIPFQLEIICKINYFIIGYSYFTSSQSFMVISIERYYVVVRENTCVSPFQGRKFLILIISSIWINSISLYFPLALLIGINPKFPNMCDIRPYDDHSSYNMAFYLMISTFIAYLVPLITVVAMYYKVIKKLKLTTFLSSNFRQRHHRQVRATKMMMIATGFFMFNALPVTIVMTVLSSIQKSYVDLVLQYGRHVFLLFSSAFLTLTLNSIQNPIIFFSFNKSIRKAMLNTLRWN